MRKKRKISHRLLLQFVVGFSATFILVSLISLIWFQQSTQCANSLSCKDEVAFKVENVAEGVFNNQKVAVPSMNLSPAATQTAVLGEGVTNANKHIYVNLATQTLSAYEDDQLFMQTLISSGLWGKTPTGDFKIWVKLKSTRMSGGSGADYYNLPNVPYVMFFSNDEVAASRGFSLHGAYWHNNFGHPMSHGCVNMRTVDAEKLYEWVDPPTNGNITYSEKNGGTVVTIFDGS